MSQEGANGKANFYPEFLRPAGLEFHSGSGCLLGLGRSVTMKGSGQLLVTAHCRACKGS